jgi:hypothetical protein
VVFDLQARGFLSSKVDNSVDLGVFFHTLTEINEGALEGFLRRNMVSLGRLISLSSSHWFVVVISNVLNSLMVGDHQLS